MAFHLKDEMPKFRLSLPALRRVVVVIFLLSCTNLFSQSNSAMAKLDGENAIAKWWQGDGALGDGFGLRPRLEDHGISLTGTLQMDILGNVSGGSSRTVAFDQGLYLYLTLDLEKLAGWKGASFQISMFDGAGRNIDEWVGNIIPASEVWVDAPTILFYNLWLHQNFGDHLAVKVGRMSAGDDFMYLPVYSDYVSGAVNTNPLSILENSPITYAPFTTWAANITVTPNEEWAILAGAYQTTPRQYNLAYHGMDFSIRPDNGIATIMEVDWTPTFGAQGGTDGKQIAKQAKDAKEVQITGLPGTYKMGGYYTYGSYDSSVNGSNTVGTFGFYWLAQQMVWQEKPGSDQGLTLWGTLTLSPQQEISLMPFFTAGGLDYKGLLPMREDDKTVFAVYYGLLSNSYAASTNKGATYYGGYELVFEWSYRAQINKFIYVQPDVQWIIPSASQGISNALVLGGEVGITF